MMCDKCMRTRKIENGEDLLQRLPAAARAGREWGYGSPGASGGASRKREGRGDEEKDKREVGLLDSFFDVWKENFE